MDRIVVLVVALSWVSCGASKASPDGADDRDARAPVDAAAPTRDASTSDAMTSPELGVDAGPANVPPVAAFSFTRDGAGAVTFDASDSVDPDGRIVRFAWDFGDASAGEGATPTHGYAEAGCPTVSLTVTDDRGATASLTRTIAVAITAPSGAPVVRLDPLPRVGSLLPRDVETNRATFTVSGDVASDGWEEVEVRVSSAGTVESTWVAPVCAGAFAHDVELVAELVSRDVAVVLRATGAPEAPIGGVNDLVAGDVLLVQGQSNAVSTQYAGDANESQSDFVRSFGTRTEDAAASVADDAWHRAEGNANEGPGAIGQWPLRMASQLVAAHGIPIAIVNGARGGRPIEYFQRNDADPADLATNYGRLLDRVRRIGAADRVRAILFYQGESDGARATEHRDGFGALVSDWQSDFPDVERFYATQVRAGCGMPSVELRDAQRLFAETLPRTSVMSTTALDGHDGCHFAYEDGYRELGDRYARLLSRDLYGAPPASDIEAVGVTDARLEGETVVVRTSGDASSLLVDDGVAADFVLTGTTRTVTSVTARASELVLALSAGPMPPTRVAYVSRPMSGPWITNAAGVGLLAFQLDVAAP